MNLRNLVPWRDKDSGVAVPSPSAHPIERMRWEMDQLFDRFFGASWPADRWGGFGEMGSWAPPLDVRETADEVVVRAEVPGVDPKDLELTVSGDLLTLTGKKEEKFEKKEQDCYHSECRYGSFHRSVKLPASIDSDKVSAEHKDGVLTIRVKKTAAAAGKKIPVKTQ